MFRDVQGVGRGGIPIAGTAGYGVGSLNIPGKENTITHLMKYEIAIDNLKLRKMSSVICELWWKKKSEKYGRIF